MKNILIFFYLIISISYGNDTSKVVQTHNNGKISIISYYQDTEQGLELIKQETLKKSPKIKMLNLETRYSKDQVINEVQLAEKYLKKVKDGSVDLIITSPPFALTREKAYGNKKGDEYLDWLKKFGEIFYKKLKDDGSFVIDFGGSWVPGEPTRNLHQFKIPIIFALASSNVGKFATF